MAINIKPSHRGLLHRKLNVPQGQKIPGAKLSAALHSSSPALRKEANFARNAKSFNHGGKGLPGKAHWGFKPEGMGEGDREHHERQINEGKRAFDHLK